MTSDSAVKIGKWVLAVACLTLVATSPLMAQEAAPPGQKFALGIPPGPLIAMVSAVILLGLLIWGIKQPLAWIVVSFLAIGAGIGCAIYGGVIYSMYINANPPMRRGDVEELMIFVAAGIGSTVAGIVLLVVALLRHRKSSVAKA